MARKRANDREAQRNIRQRTKEHIETLERKVKELEEEKREGTLEKVLRRNDELEHEVQKLRHQLSIQMGAPLPTPPIPGDMSEDMMIPKLEYFPDSGSGMWPGRAPLLVETGNNTPYSSTADTPLYSVPTSLGYAESEHSNNMYSPLDEPLWDEGMIPTSACSSAKSIGTWGNAPFTPLDHHSSRYHDMQLMPHQQQYTPQSSPCWQSQPSDKFAWQILTALKEPSSTLDHLLSSIITSRRQLAPTMKPSSTSPYPGIQLLFPIPSSKPPPPNNPLNDCMALYGRLLDKRGFTTIPEKLASFVTSYLYHTWLAAPSAATYAALHEWQAPRPSQLLIPHPAWMDLPPWGKFRDRIINNQERYGTDEFQKDYCSGFRLGWRGDPMGCAEMDNGEIIVSRRLEEWVRDNNNFSMSRAFGEKWPEFGDVCRFTE